ncbi:hypothetical protein SB822_28940 [Paraburkholderia sp. SIMBA_054]
MSASAGLLNHSPSASVSRIGVKLGMAAPALNISTTLANPASRIRTPRKSGSV